MNFKELDIITLPHPNLRKESRHIDVITGEIKEFMKNAAYTISVKHGVGAAAVQFNNLINAFVLGYGSYLLMQDKELQTQSTVEEQYSYISTAATDNKITEQESVEKSLYIINPEITAFSEETVTVNEGCMSLIGIRADVTRPKTISVKYQNLDGNIIETQISGMLAVVFQHEYDHTKGVLFTDHLPPLKKRMLEAKSIKLAEKETKRSKKSN